MSDPSLTVRTRGHAPPGAENIEPMPDLSSDEERQVFAHQTFSECLFLVATMRVEEAAEYAKQAVLALESIKRPDRLPYVRVSAAIIHRERGGR